MVGGSGRQSRRRHRRRLQAAPVLAGRSHPNDNFFFNVSLRCWQMQYAHNKSLTLSLQEALWPEAQQSTPNHTIPFLLRYCFYVDLNCC